ncbi:oxygenase [Lithospermum erythrorhizon]|uniref:Oxygenase n=1 Tax=Lithospermum erythrorhizon TaxID=34254 RepID=A0AAV3PKR1_LITER
MVVLSQPILDTFSDIKIIRPPISLFHEIPVIDLSSPDAKTEIVEACKEFGFFKVINHDVPFDFISKLEAEAVRFFKLSQSEKEKATPANPFGYGSKKIGPNGDIGWVEYLLCSMNPELAHEKSLTVFSDNSEQFWSLVNDYVLAVRNMACGVLEMIADRLRIEPRNLLSRLIKDEKSDSIFRLNHYPPCPSELQSLSSLNLLGFGEHTDPQIISVLRSNTTSGLQISVKDGTWVAVPPDPFSFFINVGDSLQVCSFIPFS